MSTSISTLSLRRGDAVRVAGIVAVIALAANFVAYAVARGLGAELEVIPPDGAAITIGVASVAFATLAPLVLGALALAVASRWNARGWLVMAWVGLSLGVLTVLMPLGADASAGTKAGIASMHVLMGLIWFVVVRQAARRPTP